MQVRLNRLQADFDAVRNLVRRFPSVHVISVQGDPPEKYKIQLNVLSLTPSSNSLHYSTGHLLEVLLPLGYPRDAPVCRMLTPVFHPNIAPHAVCIGDHWSAGESLDMLILRVCEMLAFQSYNVKSPLNGDAARWVQEHNEDLPIDSSSFILGEDSDKPDVQASANADFTCANCGGTADTDSSQCDADHRLCNDCAEHCDRCGRLLCLACGMLSCPQCDLS
jgi:ubiquitin-protein ligase